MSVELKNEEEAKKFFEKAVKVCSSERACT